MILCRKPIATIFSSPLLRARQTAQILLEAQNGARLRVSRFINEVYTPFDGHPVEELNARKWNVYDDVDPSYDQLEDVFARVQRFVSRVRHEYSGEHVVAVTHGDNIAFMIPRAAGIAITPQNKRDMSAWGVKIKYPAYASITTFIYRTSAANQVPSYRYIEPGCCPS